MQAGIDGIDIKNEPAFKKVLTITAGNIDDLGQPNTMLVFEKQLEKLQVKVGDAITISRPDHPRGQQHHRRAGGGHRQGRRPDEQVERVRARARRCATLYQLRTDATGALHIHLREDKVNDIGPLAARLRKSLEKAGYRMMEPNPQAFWMKFERVNREEWTGQKLDVTTWEDELSFMMWTLAGAAGAVHGAADHPDRHPGGGHHEHDVDRHPRAHPGDRHPAGHRHAAGLGGRGCSWSSRCCWGWAAPSPGPLIGALIAAGLNAAEHRRAASASSCS